VSTEALQQRARPIIAVAATLFIVDLFLGWQRVAVHMPATPGERTPITVAPYGRT
jgi:hypothetical protein